MTSSTKSLRILALMSGSSLDGIDIGVIEIAEYNHQFSYKIQQAKTLSYDCNWESKLTNAKHLQGKELIVLDSLYGRYNAELINRYLEEYQLEVDVISFHGHTIFHEPEQGFSYQLGSCAAIAAITKIKTVGDFRSQNVHVHGQGAPLMAIVDELIFPKIPMHINLGGICNISAKLSNECLAFDMAPCNQLLNFVARKCDMECDLDGILAMNGEVDPGLLLELKSDPYYSLEYPKSLDNNYIQENILTKLDHCTLSTEDQAATICRFILENIISTVGDLINNFEQKGGFDVLITGGGAFHPVLRAGLERGFTELGIQAIFPDKELINYKELLLMGLLAYLRLEGRVNVLGKYTGASNDQVTGCVYEG